MLYPREPYCIGKESSVLQCDRKADKKVDVRPDLPCNVIVIHGVNDVGTSFNSVEEGLCAGLDMRLHGKPGCFVSGNYRMPNAKDKDVLEADPDAVFFKRTSNAATHSPVIPFYWGYREVFKEAGTRNGQRIDRFGNRLDKDLSKGGGPFGNATSSLPDMWNRGICSPADVGGDPVRPVLSAPGRMYMVLAAKRLAALVAMIRDYDANEVVNIVAHSQGCLVSLLAQAFLLDEGKRPADTLILTHPPYSLDESTGFLVSTSEKFKSGTDAAMAGQYGPLRSRQTFDARLRTLANIVQGVSAKKHTAPAFTALTDHGKHHGMVGAKWSPGTDRDNRGKVYLYFCPEDMTVALDNMRGIGWQGVPDFMSGTARAKKEAATHTTCVDFSHSQRIEGTKRKPLSELGRGFFQRVFTSKQRYDLASKKVGPVLVGKAPHDFALRIDGEDDHAHVAKANRSFREHHEEVAWPAKPGMLDFFDSEEDKREGIRSINGEALRKPVVADLRGAGQIDPKNIPASSLQAKVAAKEQGPCEEVDPIDAAIAITSGKGLHSRYEECPDPSNTTRAPDEPEVLSKEECLRIEEHYNKEHKLDQDGPEGKRRVLGATRYAKGKVVAHIQESPNEARKRWQHEVSPKSFHGSIFGSATNHRNVTAYDLGIGGGLASSDPKFYAYLCAVADWRLQANEAAEKRASILRWSDFLTTYAAYWAVEKLERKELIAGNAKYYSRGELPACVPSLNAGLPSTVICETVAGDRVIAPPPVSAASASAKEKK